MRQRMFKVWVLLIVLSIGGIALGAIPDEVMMEWTGRAVLCSYGSERYKAFFLEPEVYSQARSDLADLRIMDDSFQKIPYIIQRGFERRQSNTTIYESQQIKSFKKKGDSFFDFKLSHQDVDKDTSGTGLCLNLPQENLLKRIEIFGSYDGEQWHLVWSGTVYRVDDLVQNEVDFAKVEKFGYYRIKVLDNAENHRILGLQLLHSNLIIDWQSFGRSTRLDYEIKEEERQTIITIRNPYRLKINRVHLKAGGNFKRRCRVFDEQGTVKNLEDTEVYNLDFEDVNVTKTQINLGKYPCASSVIYAKIDNRDNPPLNISAIDVDYLVDRVIFEATNSSEYYLFFGNPLAEHQDYDIESYREQVIRAAHELLQLEDIQVTETTAKKKETSFQWLFNVLMGAAAVVLITILLRKTNLSSTE